MVCVHMVVMQIQNHFASFSLMASNLWGYCHSPQAVHHLHSSLDLHEVRIRAVSPSHVHTFITMFVFFFEKLTAFSWSSCVNSASTNPVNTVTVTNPDLTSVF